MPIENHSIITAIREAKQPLKVSDLLVRLRLSSAYRTELKRVLRKLVRAQDIVKEGRRYGLPEHFSVPNKEPIKEPALYRPPINKASRGKAPRFVVGILRRHPDGYGFVEPLSGKRGGPFLPPDQACQAMDGDLVHVELVEGDRGRPVGKFLELVERRRTHAIGTYVYRGPGSYVAPLNAALDPIGVPCTRLAKDGDLVKVHITRPPGRRNGAEGEIVVSLGSSPHPLLEILQIAYDHGFSDEIADKIKTEISGLPDSPRESDCCGRRDLRSLRLITIDGEDAQDFDDAVYVERVKNGFRLVVAIADVAHYVQPGQLLDLEAFRRGNSVYFPNFVLPMLPERLSNGLCSLKPEETRLCMVADLVFERGQNGVNCVDADLYQGVMKSVARCTYTEVAEVLQGKTVGHREFLRGDFQTMKELAQLLTISRAERGAIEFDLPETRVILNEDYQPVQVQRRERNVAHRIIEEFMLAANEAVARYFSVRGLPTVYRVHGEPNEEKLDLFMDMARTYGLTLPEEERDGKALNTILKKIVGNPEQRTLNHFLLRSMMQAVYSPDNIGHFGLAAPFYLHFTSPIRRYPDLMVHRLLKEHWERGQRSLDEAEVERLQQRLDSISLRSSERERAAMAAEREANSYFSALYLQDKVGEEMDGIVTAVTDFGLFVELKKCFIEGLIKLQDLGEATFDEKRHRLVLPSGQNFAIGTELRVRVARVDVASRHIDLEWLPKETRLSNKCAQKAKAKKKKRAIKRVVRGSQKRKAKSM